MVILRWLVVFLALLNITTIHGQSCANLEPGMLQLFRSASFSDSNDSNAGRVEICLGGVWGTIATDSITTPWSEKNAQVACIQLGFSGALNAIFQRTIPFADRSTSPIHLSGVMCNGTESRISDCPHSNSTQNVNHGFDAYIVCRPRSLRYSIAHPAGKQSGDVRLFGDTRNGHGAVQIFTVTLGWQGICPDGSWMNNDASVICQQLGYPSGSVATPVEAIRGPGDDPLSRDLYDAKCPGISADEVTTDLCSFRLDSTVTRCAEPEGRFAAVQCSYASDQLVRLIGGSDRQEGIVEIAFNGRWGMLCNGRFQSSDAAAICQGLGFGADEASVMSISSTSTSLQSESNLRPIWLNNLDCISSDNSLPSCIREQNIIGYANCRSSSIVAVDCGDPPPFTPGEIAGITIGVLVFVAIAIPLLIILFDEKKKKATIAKLNAAKARIARIRCPKPSCPRPSCPKPSCPKPSCPKLPRRQPQHRSVEPTTQPTTVEPRPLEPSNSGPLYQIAVPAVPQAPQLPTAPQLPAAPQGPPVPPIPEKLQDPSHFDEPPPYPGGAAYPPPFPASAYYQGYPPPSWNPVYPPAAAAVPPGVGLTADTACPNEK